MICLKRSLAKPFDFKDHKGRAMTGSEDGVESSAGVPRMISKRIKQVLRRKPRDQTWKQIDRISIPLSAGRIWLVGKDGNVRRAIAWTWPILKRREPNKYQWWMNRIGHAREPTPEALAALATLRRDADD